MFCDSHASKVTFEGHLFQYPRGATRSGFKKTALRYGIRFGLIHKISERVLRGFGADSQAAMVNTGDTRGM